MWTVFVQIVKRPIRLHSEPPCPLQADSATNSEALSGHSDVYCHEPPTGSSTGNCTKKESTGNIEFFWVGWEYFLCTWEKLCIISEINELLNKCFILILEKTPYKCQTFNVDMLLCAAGSPMAYSPCRHDSVIAALSGAEFGRFKGALFAHWNHQ